MQDNAFILLNIICQNKEKIQFVKIPSKHWQ